MIYTQFDKNTYIFDINTLNANIKFELLGIKINPNILMFNNIITLNMDAQISLTLLNHKDISEFVLLSENIKKSIKIKLHNITQIIHQNKQCILFDLMGNKVYFNVFDGAIIKNVFENIIEIGLSKNESRFVISSLNREELTNIVINNDLVFNNEITNMENKINNDIIFNALTDTAAFIGVYSVIGVDKVIFNIG
jgi:hypothetical protein